MTVGRWLSAIGIAALLAVGLLACQEQPAVEGGLLRGEVLAGPTCPVVSEPPDPACADRPVAGATLVIQRDGGGEVARLTTDGEGRFETGLATGRYVLVPQPVEGLLGTAPSQPFTIKSKERTDLIATYDTGIR